MGKIFDLENPFWSFVAKLVDALWLNLIFIIFSLPIVTIGASITAMYSVTLKMVRDREGYMFQGFWKSFKTNFKQATFIWIGVLILGTILGVDFYFFFQRPELYAKIAMALLFGLTLIAACTVCYVFPILAQFDNSIKQTLKNALMISIKHLPWTVFLLLLYAAAALGLYLVPGLLVFFLFGVLAFATSYIYSKIFMNYIPEEMRNDY